MPIKPISLLFFLVMSLQSAHSQGTVPTFLHTVGNNSYTLVGRDPVQAGTTTIPAVLVPITLFRRQKICWQALHHGCGRRRIARSPLPDLFQVCFLAW